MSVLLLDSFSCQHKKPDLTNQWSMTSIGNQWVISWLVIDYWWWSMSNRWVIEAKNFVAYRLLIAATSITHWWPIDYLSTIILCTKDTFLAFLYDFFSSVILLSVLDAFFLVSEDPVDDVETQSANHKYSFLNFVFLRWIRLQPRDDIDE